MRHPGARGLTLVNTAIALTRKATAPRGDVRIGVVPAEKVERSKNVVTGQLDTANEKA